jgi:subtilisin family serine protease
MKLPFLNPKGILVACAILLVGIAQAQKLKQDSDYVPNQVLVKFKDDVKLNPNLFRSNVTGIAEVDNLLRSFTIKKLDNIFSPIPPNMESGLIKSNSIGNLVDENDRRIHFIQLQFEQDSIDVLGLIKQLKAVSSIEFAEPNYYFSIDATMGENKQPIELKNQKPIFNAKDLVSKSLPESNLWKTTNTKQLDYFNAVSPNDPLFSQQANITGSNIQKAWEVTTGDSIVVGVLDTGVDWLHPDLKDNIWINWKEFYGRSGVDDDGNGLIDDVRGWDWINNDNNPTDDHSHGTHVAGIIAAKGNNGIGITGVNWNAKIMPLKILQSTGRGDAATIAKAVDYAALMGAKILNLSLGGYFESLTMKSSLEKAYASSLIVAAAGNDARCIGPGIGCAPLYPGAYSFVMGAQDRALYSNFDQDGPFKSQYSNLMNYDTYAPGSSIISTVPEGTYTNFTGTSMSTPTVAGIASLYMSTKKIYDKELLYAQLIQQQTNGFVDAYKILTVVPPPDLRIAKFEIVDTATTSNKDGKPDAGENINLRIYLKNYSAKADSVSIKVSYAPMADTSLVKFIQDSCFVGSVSPNTVTYSLSPLNIKISDKVFHGADYKINVAIKDTKGNSWNDELVITFQNAITFGGIITNDVTLYPNRYYYVTENVILDGAKLIIKPGTTLNFSQGKGIRGNNNGVIIALGKKDSLITFTSNSGWVGMQFQKSGPYDSSSIALNNGNWQTSYPKLDNLLKTNYLSVIDTVNNNTIFKYCIIENLVDVNGSRATIAGGIFFNTLFRNNNTIVSIGTIEGNFIEPIIIASNFFNNKMGQYYPTRRFKAYNNHINNFPYNNMASSAGPLVTSGLNILQPDFYKQYSLNVFNNENYNIFSGNGSSTYSIPSNIYMGTIDSLKISTSLYDYFDNNTANAIIIKNFKTNPCDSCPGIVWKLTIDDKEFASNASNPEDIIELGTHKIKVWFNRVMDTTVTPNISFGQREPYNQVSFTNKGKWATDKKSYEVNREFVVTDPNGIVNFNVSGAKDDMGMEIPYERTRFRINLQSSSSKTLNFGLTNQCGKLFLKWDNLRTQGSDIIGYNLFRRIKTPSNSGAFTLLNKKLVTDNFFTDFKVDVDSAYDYVYTAVRAGMNNETDSSFIVSGQPLRSKLADANGDSAINVSDVVTAVNRILQKDPVPFVLKQTDMNNDGIINVLDVIGIINRILNPSAGSVTGKYDYNSKLSAGKLNLYLIGDTLYGKSEMSIAGIEYEGAHVKEWLAKTKNWEVISY